MFQTNHHTVQSFVQQRQQDYLTAAATHRLVRDVTPARRQPRRFAPFGRRSQRAPQLALS